MKRREWIKSVLIATSGVVLLAGCSKGTETGDSGGATTLTIWVLEENVESPDIYQQIADEFTKRYPNFRIVIERRANDAYKEALRLAINTSVAPDGYFSWSGVGLGGFYVRKGGAAPLTQYYHSYHWTDRFNKIALNSTFFGGTQYGVPFRIRGMGIYYRKDAFAAAGITEKPSTYDALLVANRKLLAAGYVPLGMGGKYGWMLMRLMDSLLERNCGAKTCDALRNLDADWSSEPGVLAAYADLKHWADSKVLTPDFLGIDPTNVRMSVYQGKAAMMYEGDWMIDFLRSDGMALDDYDFFPFPTGTGRLSLFTEMFFIGSTSKHPDAVAKFYDFWTSSETQRKHAGQFGPISTTVGIDLPAEAPQQAREWRKVANDCLGAYAPSDQALPLEICGSYLRCQAGVVSGEFSPQAAARTMQRDIIAYKRKSISAANKTG